MEKNKKTVQLHFMVTEQEAALVQERMDILGIRNRSAYLRKMSIDGYIINLDLSDVRELVTLLRHCSNNLNQYARKANETGSIYAADIADLQGRLDGLWSSTGKVLSGLSEVP